MLGFEELLERLESLENVTTVVCEDYRLRQGKQTAQTGSRFVAVQIIGALKAYAKRHKAKMVLQDATILTVAALHSGVKRPSNHSKSHDTDAYNHGYYYFETKGLLQPKTPVIEFIAPSVTVLAGGALLYRVKMVLNTLHCVFNT